MLSTHEIYVFELPIEVNFDCKILSLIIHWKLICFNWQFTLFTNESLFNNTSINIIFFIIITVVIFIVKKKFSDLWRSDWTQVTPKNGLNSQQ